MKQQLLAAAFITCSVSHVVGPGKPGYLIQCPAENGGRAYLPKYPKTLKQAEKDVRKYAKHYHPAPTLEALKRRNTTSIQALRNEGPK